MFRNLWFHKLLGLSSRSQRRRQAAQQRKPVCLRLESLEDRVTPATTLTLNAATATQLQADVATANSDPTHAYLINLTSPSTYNLTANVIITNKLGVTIQGTGQAIHAEAEQRAFTVNPGAKASFNNVIIEGGDVDGSVARGGGIADFGGTVTLSGATVQSNAVDGTFAAAGPAQGGGVFVSGGGTLSILNHSVIQNNMAQGTTSSGGAGAEGGGVYVSGGSTLIVDHSSITGNLAQGANPTGKGAAGGGGFAAGGGLFVTGAGSSVTITASQISSNNAFGGAGHTGTVGTSGGAGTAGTIGKTGGAAFGGGAFIGHMFGGGATGADPVTVNISASPFSNNTAAGGLGGTGGAGGLGSATAGGAGGKGGAGGFASGGGLWLDTTVAGNVMVNSSLTGNQANGGGGGLGGEAGNGKLIGGAGGTGGTGGGAAGGGATLLGEFSLINSTSATNQANGGIGGLGGANGAKVGVTPIGTGAQGATGTSSGGGILASGFVGTGIRLINNTVFGNQATGSIGSVGGGIDFFGGTTLINNLALNNSTSFVFDSTTDIAPFPPAFNLTTPLSGLPVVGSPLTTADGVVFYPLLPGAPAINTGTNSVLPEIAKAEGVVFNPLDFSNIKDIAGNLRVINGIIDIGAEEFSPTSFATSVAFLNTQPININTSSQFQPLTVEVKVTFPPNGLPVTEGSVSFQITDSLGKLVGGPTPGIPSAPGLFTGVFSIPANIKPGTYTITATYTDPFIGGPTGKFAGGVGTTSLVVNPAPTPASTTLTPGSAAITTSASAQSVGIPVLVSSPGGTVGTGTVTVNLLNNGVTVATGSNTVVGGSTTVNLTVPGGLAAGTYTLQESYHDASGAFVDSSGFGTLAVAGKATALTAGNASVAFSASSQPAGVPVLVTSPSGTVNEGTVTVAMLNNGVIVAIASNTVSNGSTVVTLTVPAGQKAGSYT